MDLISNRFAYTFAGKLAVFQALFKVRINCVDNAALDGA